jgi:superfamily II DNA or RNA helicase/HKD family nuclease
VKSSSLELFGRDTDFGYIDRTVRSPREFHPRLVLNTATDSMLRALRHELRNSTSFTFSVAFVSPGAIALLKKELVEYEGVGRIVTSDYLGFNSPHAFSELLNLRHSGIDVRLHNRSAFHPKGYVFQRPDGVTAILGSSNLTESALARTHEWNIRVSATRESDLATQLTNVIDAEFLDSSPLTQAWIDQYASRYQPPATPQSQSRIPATNDPGDTAREPATMEIVPNAMQVDALGAIARVREAGKDRALVISATGTGKTILSALDVRAVNPDRLLFVAHREQILDRAMREFQRVLGAPATDFGKLAGSSRQTDRRYVFATVQTLSQPHVLEALVPEAFDYLLIDEVHRAGADSFARILDHFRPAFRLGMTATPERTDGQNIFKLFDYNVPYEIRLNSALELDMLAPFHYFGIADITFGDGLSTSEFTPLMRLVNAERVEHLLQAIRTYGQAGVAPRGLIFCSRKEEAQELSRELNKRTLHGKRLRTRALTGQDSMELREQAVDELERGELDYILTVDIFNEGVDIPTLNQVIMLRQTQSSIVFIQQLGRGLRKSEGKDYLIVIDFIGNYTNNYLIPIALFGDESLNKESLRKNLVSAEETGVIAGLSSVRFDRIAQERVLQSLATVKLDSLHNLKGAIETVRRRVGRSPLLADFLRFESVDPVILATKEGNYPTLLAKLKIKDIALSADESLALTVLSRELLTAKRPHELLLLRHLLTVGSCSYSDIVALFDNADVPASKAVIDGSLRSLNLDFNTKSELQNYKICGPVEVADEVVQLSQSFAASYASSPDFKESVNDVVETGLTLISSRYDSTIPFTPGKQYSRKDASRLLNWTSNMYSTIYGYKIDKGTKSCPIFITLHKSSEISASTAYDDQLLDHTTMLWYTRSNKTLNSTTELEIIGNNVDLHVFAKKDDAEGAGFYYLGQSLAFDAEQTTMAGNSGKKVPVVRMHLKFEAPIPAALFDYFHTDLTN